MYSWLTTTREEVAFGINQAVKVSIETLCKDEINKLNRGTNRMRRNLFRELLYTNFSLSLLRILFYADILFAINDGLSSQLGYLILLCDELNNCPILDSSSRKLERVVRSMMAAEVYDSMEAFHAMTIIASEYLLLLKKINLY